MYWLDTIYKDDKSLLIKTIKNGAPSVVLIDNGPGFKEDISEIVTPFYSRKGDGIGIGLYLVDTLMMKYGKFEMLTKDDLIELNIPEKYNGAGLKLTFNKNQ